MRVFTAISIPDSCRSVLGSAMDVLKKGGFEASWSPLQNLHLTLVFLGEAEPADVARIRQHLEVAICGVESFTLYVQDLCSLGRSRRPRVLCAAVEPCPSLIRIQQLLTDRLRMDSWDIEDRPYFPHITLGRIKPRHRVPYDWQDRLREVAAGMDQVSFPVDGIDIMQSHLEKQGSRYEVVEHLSFPE